MNTTELFKGVAVVIDDEINNRTANIRNILNQIERKNIPFLTFTSIPSDEIISNFQNLSFLLLDWRLIKDEMTSDDLQAGVTIPSTLRELEADENIEFIEKLMDVCFCPVFIFSNEDKNGIIEKLESAGIYSTDRPNHIFVKSKSDITGRTKLFKEIDKWIKSNPSVYVLKEWENEYQRSKNKLFMDFQKLSPVWPKIMWKNFGDDSANKSLELGELISRNLHTRKAPFEFSYEILSKRGKKIDRLELRRVLEGGRFISRANLHENDIAPGDVFKVSSKYYVNIRAACDLIPDRAMANSSQDNVQLYLLKGTKLSDKQIRKFFKKEYGHFSETHSQAIIFPLSGGKAIDFRFKKLEIKQWSELKDNRIGRILPPHIDTIRQKYGLYLQRQGVPRTPDIAVFANGN